jgi:uncharacterized protein involved in exopolysaccharide biosynthesis
MDGRPVSSAPIPTLGDDIRTVFSVLWSGRKIIAASALLAVVLAAAYAFVFTDTLYAGRAELLFDPRQTQAVSGSATESTVSNNTPEAHATLIDSQVQIISSEELARRLITEEQLNYDPEFVGTAGGSEEARYNAALETYYDRLSVGRTAATYVISISIESVDPAKAAHLANRLAEIYLAVSSGTDATLTSQTADALDSRLANLRLAANTAAAEVETYRRENGLIGADDLLVVDQQLSDLNNQISLARVERSSAEANLAQVQRAADSGALALDGASLDSTVIAELQVQLATLEGQEARLRALYLPQHPALAGVIEEKQALSAALNAEFSRVMARLQREYDVAVEKVASLEAQVADLQDRSADSNSASVRLVELQREAEAAQTVYETFLNRSLEMREQVGLPTDAARIISPAYAQSKPSSPRKVIFVAAGAVLGAGMGVVWVWIAHIVGPAGQRPAAPNRATEPARPAVRQRQPERPAQPAHAPRQPDPGTYTAPASIDPRTVRSFARPSEMSDPVISSRRNRSFARPSELGAATPIVRARADHPRAYRSSSFRHVQGGHR